MYHATHNHHWNGLGMDARTSIAAATTVTTTIMSSASLMQVVHLYVGLTGSLLGIFATCLVTYWRWQDRRGKKKSK